MRVRMLALTRAYMCKDDIAFVCICVLTRVRMIANCVRMCVGTNTIYVQA